MADSPPADQQQTDLSRD